MAELADQARPTVEDRVYALAQKGPVKLVDALFDAAMAAAPKNRQGIGARRCRRTGFKGPLGETRGPADGYDSDAAVQDRARSTTGAGGCCRSVIGA